MPSSKKYSPRELAAAVKRVETVYNLSGYDAAFDEWRTLKLPVIEFEQVIVRLLVADDYNAARWVEVRDMAEFPHPSDIRMLLPSNPGHKFGRGIPSSELAAPPRGKAWQKRPY